MTGLLSRRQCFFALPGAYAAVAGARLALADSPEPTDAAPAARVHAEFPAQRPELVREVVGASHRDLDRVRALVEASPALAKATWDWGFGDWESALGAASHVGRADIAELLISHGARPDIFTLAMLGKVDAVRAWVSAVPGIQRTHGPHGITLLQHARNGGDDARPVVEYLETLGDADTAALSLELTDAMKSVYVGKYAFGAGAEDSLEVLTNKRGELTIQRASRNPLRLHRVEEHGFAPVGAPSVRIRFKVSEDRAVSVSVHDPEPMITAERAG
jgi:hypothetical protein